jgi:outer membrane protein
MINMKTIIPGLIAMVCLISAGFSQRYGFVDTEYILENIPEYKDAQNQLDDLSRLYQTEVEEKFGELDRMFRNFQAEAVLMPDDVKKKKELELQEKEKEIKLFQNQRFGVNGDLFMKREELVKPIQEKIFNAIEEIATDGNYAFVFDRAGSLTILFGNPRFDLSDDVLDKVGTVLGTVRKEDRVKREYQPSAQPSSTRPGSSGPATRSTSPTPQRGGPGGTSPGPVNKPDRK